MAQDTNVNNLIINKLTKAQYDNIQNPSDTELYLVTDDIGITSSEITTILGYTPENVVNKVTYISSISTDAQYPSAKAVYTQLNTKQAKLVSGTNIKTINNNSILGSGNITIDSLPSQTGQSGKFLTTNGSVASWSNVSIPTVDQTFDGTSTNAQSGVAIAGELNNYQSLIASTNMLSSDLVDDTNNTHKFATSAQLTQIETNQTDITTINGKIPSQASTSNQLADKAFVNSSVQTATANFRGNWDTWALVPTSASSYPADYAGSTTPTVNDYLVVQDASDYTGDTLEGTWRFKYTGTWSIEGKSGWNPEYQVNETPLTAAQLAALDSGITSNDVSLIGTALQPGDLPTNYVTTDTAQDISGKKTFLGEKAIYFKQQTTSNKLGFTLYNPSNAELGALEYRPNTISGSSLLNLNCPQTTSDYVGFRYWGSPAVNIVAPKVATAGNYFIPTHITNGNTTVTASNTGTVNISTLLPDVSNFVTNSSLATTLGDYAPLYSDVDFNSLTLDNSVTFSAETDTDTGDKKLIVYAPIISMGTNDYSLDFTSNGVSINGNTVATQTWIQNQNFIQNNDSSWSNLNIFGQTPTVSGTGNINIGENSLVNGSYSIALGYNATVGYDENVNYTEAVAIGNYARCSANRTIQLGGGINETANTLQIGRYTLLNTSTGLIPDERLSTNIARTSQIPSVDSSLNKNSTNPVQNKAIAEAIEDISLAKNPNMNLIGGSLNIDSGNVSGFSTTDYMQFPFVFNFNGYTWTLEKGFTTGSDVTTQQNLIDSYYGIAFAIRNGKFVLAISSNGNSWDIANTEGTYSVQANTAYSIKIAWDGSNYTLSYALDETNYTTDITVASALVHHSTQEYVGGEPDLYGSGQHPFTGTINLNKWNLIVNGLEVWLGMDDVGLGSRANVDLSNLTEAGLSMFQAPLVSGTNIKTINNTSLLGSGNISIPIVTVDQTYDGASTDAQSGVAIEGKLSNYATTSDLATKQDKLTAGTNISIGYVYVPSTPAQTIDATNITAVTAYANSFYVALTSNGSTKRSTDFETWTDGSAISSGSYWYYIVSNTNLGISQDGYICSNVGNETSATLVANLRSLAPVAAAKISRSFIAINSSGYISTSTNLTNWSAPTEITTLSNAGHQWHAIDYSPDSSILVAASMNNKVSISTDGGNTWSTPLSAPFGNRPFKIRYLDGKFYSISQNGQIYTSSNGTSWSSHGSLSSSFNWVDIVLFNDKITGISADGYTAYIEPVLRINNTQSLSGYEQTSNKVTSISSSSTDTQYPSAKAVWDNTLHTVTYDSTTETLRFG